MAGTMPHAVFVETGWDGADGVAAYAAELPGCATFAATDADAVAGIPLRASRFGSWLRAQGEDAPQILGDNWYEVERAAATNHDGLVRRAAFSLDELPPSDEEFVRWLRWLELAREELATAMDEHGADEATGLPLAAIAEQDATFVRELGRDPGPLAGSETDRVYVARDALTDALEAAGSSADGVRRILRLAIADDLHAAARLRGEDAS
jgi:hypothetical protein